MICDAWTVGLVLASLLSTLAWNSTVGRPRRPDSQRQSANE